MSYRTLSVGQRSQVWIAGPDLSDPKLLFETDDLLVEAPNWTTDGAALIVNGAGQVWRLEVEGEPAGLVKIDYQDLPDVNNDHVLDPASTRQCPSCGVHDTQQLPGGSDATFACSRCGNHFTLTA